jgi:hypothetical protein
MATSIDNILGIQKGGAFRAEIYANPEKDPSISDPDEKFTGIFTGFKKRWGRVWVKTIEDGGQKAIYENQYPIESILNGRQDPLRFFVEGVHSMPPLPESGFQRVDAVAQRLKFAYGS